MVFNEQSEEEPDDPEFDVLDGDDLIPDSPTDAAGSGDGFGDAPTEVKTTFWAVVLLVDVALIGLIVGPAVIYLTGELRLGGLLLLIGLFCTGSAYRRYREFDSTTDSG